jgi:hypothetical protein
MVGFDDLAISKLGVSLTVDSFSGGRSLRLTRVGVVLVSQVGAHAIYCIQVRVAI